MPFGAMVTFEKSFRRVDPPLASPPRTLLQPVPRLRAGTHPVDGFEPMLVDEATAAFDDPAWSFEVKHDGYRLLAGVRAQNVKLKTRNSADATLWFPEVVAALRCLAGPGLVLDGEVCILDEHGRSDFERLRRRVHGPLTFAAEPVVYLVFDVLMAGGRRLVDRPLAERRLHLEALRDLPGIKVVDAIDGDGEALFAHALRLGLEGIVAKRLASPYQPGLRSDDWLKIKCPGPALAERFKRFPGG
ncbi:ATP-dependent DNA ligase [Rhizobacter sp. LjRoot28]|uniref:ATP-dependent DNA ligase n=1 Tax=Rhizobacter sp. LjRoot28 TaxID=3342309 RepID=UPI003ECE6382